MPDTTSETAADTTEEVAETTATDTAATAETTAAEFPDWAKDPATAQRMVDEARAQAAQERVKAREGAKADARKELLEQLGLADADETPDPAELAKQLAAKDTAIRDLTIKSALSEALNAAKAKPLARAAILGEGLLNDLDPTADDFETVVASRVAEYITKNPELRTAQAASVGGADLTGGSGQARTYSRDQLADPAFFQANKTDILAAYSEGRITA